MIRPLSFSTTENTSQFHFGKSLSSSLLFSRHQRRKNKNKKQTGRIIYIYREREREISMHSFVFFFFTLLSFHDSRFLSPPLLSHLTSSHLPFRFFFFFCFQDHKFKSWWKTGGERERWICLSGDMAVFRRSDASERI